MYTIEIPVEKAINAMQWLDTTLGNVYTFESTWPKRTIKFKFEDSAAANFFKLKWL
jgi:hypothetical protein